MTENGRNDLGKRIYNLLSIVRKVLFWGAVANIFLIILVLMIHRSSPEHDFLLFGRWSLLFVESIILFIIITLVIIIVSIFASDRLLLGISMALFSIFITAGLLEITVRIAQLDPAIDERRIRERSEKELQELFIVSKEIPNFVEFRPNTVTVHRGVEVRINSIGLRDCEYPLKPGPNTCRILAMGDSVTFGQAVEEQYIWPTVLENQLNESSQRTLFEVINGGHPDSNTLQQLEYFKNRLSKLQPHLIILGFLAMNDTELTERKNYRVLADETKRRNILNHIPMISKVFSDHSALYRLMISVGDQYIRQRLWQDVYIWRTYKNDFQGWQDAQRAFIGFYQEAQRIQARLIVLIFPIKPSSLNDAAGRNVNYYFGEYPYHIIHQKVSNALSQAGSDLKVIDLLNYMPHGIPPNDLVVRNDGHPNSLWHHIVGTAVYQEIKQCLIHAHD